MILLRPLRYFLQRFQGGRTMPLPTLFYDDDQAAFRQDAHMLGNGGLTDLKIFCYGVQGQCLTGQQSDDCPSCRIGNGLENISACFHKYITEWLSKTIQNHSVYQNCFFATYTIRPFPMFTTAPPSSRSPFERPTRASSGSSGSRSDSCSRDGPHPWQGKG